MTTRKRFALVLIKPSHDDDEGYVTQRFRLAIPANLLACLYGLTLECRAQNILGEDVSLEIHAFDETNTKIKIKNIIKADLNKYDLNHAVTAHPKMSKEAWEETYHKAWKTYYTDAHIETVLRRAIATGTSPDKTMFLITWLKDCIDIERIPRLEGGFLRRKHRALRRSDLPLENPLIFYPKSFFETLWKQVRWISLYSRLRLICRKVRKDPKKLEYMDLDLETRTENETERRELFQSEAAHNFFGKV